MNYMNPQPYTQPQQQQMSTLMSTPRYVPKTAINELDAFMAGLTEEDRESIFSTPDFGARYTDFMNRFMFYLLQGELGTEFISGAPQRREHAEQLKLMAHSIYSENKKSTVSEIDALKRENEALNEKLLALSKQK